MNDHQPRPRANRRRRTREPTNSEAVQLAETGDQKLDDFRRRMQSVGTIVRDVFGAGGAPDPTARVLDAYLIVVSCIIETMVHSHETVSTADLLSLSKALAEQRRLDISRLEIERRFPEKVPTNDTLSAGDAKPLPGGFGGLVEQIYGTNLADKSSPNEPDP